MRRAVQQENASYLYLQQTLMHPVALFIRSLSFLLFHHRAHSFRFYHVPRVVVASLRIFATQTIHFPSFFQFLWKVRPTSRNCVLEFNLISAA